MKKFFLFAAAAIAALSVNARVVTFAEIIDKTSAESAVSSFNAAFECENISVAGKANSDNTAYCAELSQITKSPDWETTFVRLKNEDQVFFAIKDENNDNKLVMKVWADYIQPAGKSVCLVVSDLNIGDQITINLKDALNKEAAIQGATIEKDNLTTTSLTLTAKESEIRLYSRNLTPDGDGKYTDAKWKLISVEVPDARHAVENVNAAIKVEKFFRNGQLIIRKNGVEFNALGAQL